MNDLTVEDVLGLREGALVELTRGEALIRGRWQSFEFFGVQFGPMLVMDARIGQGYNVAKLVELGWQVRIVAETDCE